MKCPCCDDECRRCNPHANTPSRDCTQTVDALVLTFGGPIRCVSGDQVPGAWRPGQPLPTAVRAISIVPVELEEV